MGGLQIDCPLCCERSFDSKNALLEHLNHIEANLYCPLCNSKYTSLKALSEHLSLTDCQSVENNTVQNVVVYEQNIDVNKIHDIKTHTNVSEIKTDSPSPEPSTSDTQYVTDETYESQDDIDDNSDVKKMYVDLLSKQDPKTVLQTQELQLVKAEGENRYVIISHEEAELSEDSAILTKQNNDGTISLNSIEELRIDSNPLLSPMLDMGPFDEIYTCNTCKVSFTSVLDHIRKYHSDQEVVLEEGDEELPTSEKQAPRRVITETGDIVEEPIPKSDEAVTEEPRYCLDRHGRMFTETTIQTDPNNIDKNDTNQKVLTKQTKKKNRMTVKMYNCMSCNITVDNLAEFEAHPCKILKYACPRCPAGFENCKSLCAHMKVHKEKADGSPDVPPPYECEVCATVFPTNKSLKLHKRMHDPIKARPIEPPVENNDGKDVTSGKYRCTTCDKMIPFDYRTIHENSHKTSNMMNCSICNKKFTSMDFMEMHMNVHNLDKVTVNKQDKSLPYKCLYCNRRFARPHEKVKHERIHTGEKPHSCEICGKSFRVSYCLTLHMRTHTGARPYECPHCGKRFKAHSVYNHHLLTHSEVRAYKCPYCPKAFKTSVQLAGHKNSHTKPFSCQHCNRPFASLYAVRVHTETHNRQNNLKFSCTQCGASYARAFALKDHVKQVHKRDMDNADNTVETNQDDPDDWIVTESPTEQDGMQTLNKELQQTITDLEMRANELIVP